MIERKDHPAMSAATSPPLHRYRSHTCGALRDGNVGNHVRLSGWVHNIRDLGGLLFIDLRDHYGITQIVAEPGSAAFKDMERARKEWVIRIDGDVKKRTPETANDKLATGHVEVYVRSIEILSEAKELPVPVLGEPEYPEDLRLQYRFLDLRRETLHKNIMQRVAIIKSIRRRMEAIGFNEFDTPIMTASSPEGARDFLVPSRIHPGKFFALPQAPQQYKQLLMVSGFDRYYQIAPCFRDEDPRADRTTEFYQLDVEMSFVEQEDVFQTMEPVITGIFEEFAHGKAVTKGWSRIPYDEAIRKYGTDKPDLRNPIEIQDVTEHFRGSGFKVFAGMIEKDPKVRVWAIPGPTGGSRAFCDRMNGWAQKEGQPGLGYIFWRDEEGPAGAGPVAKNVGPDRAAAIQKQLGLKTGDAVFFTAGDPAKFYKFAGLARDQVGRELKLVKEDQFALCWIVDFPFYEWSDEDKRLDFAHNPFSMPKGGIDALNAATTTEQRLALKANQYDIVCNGYEITSGSIRNHKPETMVKAFEITGLTQKDVEDRFGGLYRAFQFGAPPHGGMAAGIDRIIMLLVGAKNLREVNIFPMNQSNQDLLMGAPSEVMNKQLRELSIRVNIVDDKKG
jgi:aspartyl-tRNA synthetase